MSIYLTRVTDLSLADFDPTVRLTKIMEVVGSTYPTNLRLTACRMLVLCSVEEAPPEPPGEPPVEPPSPPPPPEEAPIIRRSDVTAVINKFGQDMLELLELYADSGASGFSTRSRSIDMNHHRIINSSTAGSVFDAVTLQEATS